MTDRLTELKAKKTEIDHEELVSEIEKSKGKGRLTERLGEMIIEMVEGYSRLDKWRNYDSLDDWKGDAIMTLCNRILNYDDAKARRKNSRNPSMAYATMIIYHSFLKSRQKEERTNWKVKEEITNRALSRIPPERQQSPKNG